MPAAMTPTKIPTAILRPQCTTPSLKYWHDCADRTDILALWEHPAARNEWIAAGERPGYKVHLSRPCEGQPQITEVETRAIAEIIVKRHFTTVDPVMICAIAEIESSRNPLAFQWEQSRQEARTGIMQMLQSTADWLSKEMGYVAYTITIDSTSLMLYRPFASIYFGAAYLQWLSEYEDESRCEEFIVRGYSGGPENAARESTAHYWTRYLIAKQNIQLQSSQVTAPESALNPSPSPGVNFVSAPSQAFVRDDTEEITTSKEWTYWEEKCSHEDIDSMWDHPDVKKEWAEAAEQRGKVRFSRDAEKRPVLTMTQVKAIAENITTRFFADKRLSSVMLSAIADISSDRVVHGRHGQGGIMGLSFETAMWLYREMGFQSYTLKAPKDLSRPFVCMYFAAAYLCWLSNHNNRTRTDEFIVRAYKSGVEGTQHPASEAFWLHYWEVQSFYRSNAENQSHSAVDSKPLKLFGRKFEDYQRWNRRPQLAALYDLKGETLLKGTDIAGSERRTITLGTNTSFILRTTMKDHRVSCTITEFFLRQSFWEGCCSWEA